MPKISVLPDGSALAGTETTPLVQGGATVKLTWNVFAAFVVGYNGQLSAIAGLTSAADRVPFFTGSGTAALATFTAAGRALVDDADASAQLTTLGVSTFAKTILDDADAAAVRATIGAASSAASGDVTGPASATNLHIAQFDGTTGKLLKDGGALGTAAAVDTGTSGTKIPLLSAANTWTLAQTFTAAPVFTDASGSRTALGLAIGTNVQAWDADLDALAALSGTDTIYYRSAANTWSAVTVGTGLSFTGGALTAPGSGSGTVTSVGLTSSDITVGGATSPITTTGTYTLTITAGAVTLAKIANAAASSKLLGSGASGSGASYAEITLGTNLSMSGTTLNATGGGTGYNWNIPLTPYMGEPPASNYGRIGTRNNHPVLNFDTTTQETIYFSFVVPLDYSGGGITVYLVWAAATATSGTIGWLAAIERDGTTLDIDGDSFGADQTITAVTVNATSGIPSTASVAFTNGTQMSSLAAGELGRLRIKRDVANDTATGDAQLLSVVIRPT